MLQLFGCTEAGSYTGPGAASAAATPALRPGRPGDHTFEGGERMAVASTANGTLKMHN